MDITFLYYVAGLILFLALRSSVAAIKRQREIDLKVKEYLSNNSKFIRIDKIEESAVPLYIAYNFLTNDFVAQGATEDEAKANASAKWPTLDIFVVSIDTAV